ncbi:MAG TPA: alpha/beta hydrolase, partial [Flavobacteriaceae bacterium]|nr:alpha/beta hydrolase [Flavobacteriaceae bacterium]
MQKQSLDYQINGVGKDVVLLHGFLESPIIWEEFLQVADGDFRSINVHIPNHHSSNASLYFNDLTEQAEILYHTLIEANVQSPILIGHSLGGYLALAFIDRYPEFASGIALVNSSCLDDTIEQKKRRTR